jgi:hypothetical protein
VIAAEPRGTVRADRHLYHVGGRPEHGFVFRALLGRSGLVLLEDWDLHRLIHAATRTEPRAFRAAARRAAGDTGEFVAALVERGVGGEMLPLLVPLLEPVLDAGCGIVAFSRDVRERAAAARPRLPLVHVPLPLVVDGPPRDRAEARREVGVAGDRVLVAVLAPEGGLARDRLRVALAPLREDRGLDLRDLPPGGDAHDRLLSAADLLVALEHPSRGRLDPAIGRALHGGVATLVTAGSTAARELPEGVVVSVSPGETEAAELQALVLRLSRDPPLRARVGALARARAAIEGDPARSAARLVAFAGKVGAEPRETARPAGPASGALDEAAWTARSAGLGALPADVATLAASLFPQE